MSTEYLELRDKERLQIAVKAVNNTARPNSLVLTLLVFKAYPRLTKLDPLNPLVEQRAKTIKKVIKEVQRLYIQRRVNDVLTTRNRLNTLYIHNLQLKDKVLV